MRRRLLTGTAVGIVTLLATTAPAFAGKWAATTNGVASVCFTADGLPADAVKQAPLTAAVWNSASSNLKVAAINCPAGAVKIPMKPTEGQGNVLGTTHWSETNGGTIMEADIVFAATSINSWGRSTGGVGGAWRGVLCHEMGHALGLEHSKDSGSCMQTGTDHPFPYPSNNDFSKIRSLYGGASRAIPASATVQGAKTPNGSGTATASNNGIGTVTGTNGGTVTRSIDSSNTKPVATAPSTAQRSVTGGAAVPTASGGTSGAASAPGVVPKAGSGLVTGTVIPAGAVAAFQPSPPTTPLAASQRVPSVIPSQSSVFDNKAAQFVIDVESDHDDAHEAAWRDYLAGFVKK